MNGQMDGCINYGLAAHRSGPTGVTRDCNDFLNHRKVSHLQFCTFLTHNVTLTVSCAGLSIQIPGIQGTAWGLFGLAAHRSGPSGVTRDCKDLPNHRIVSHLQFCNIIVT